MSLQRAAVYAVVLHIQLEALMVFEIFFNGMCYVHWNQDFTCKLRMMIVIMMTVKTIRIIGMIEKITLQ